MYARVAGNDSNRARGDRMRHSNQTRPCNDLHGQNDEQQGLSDELR